MQKIKRNLERSFKILMITFYIIDPHKGENDSIVSMLLGMTATQIGNVGKPKVIENIDEFQNNKRTCSRISNDTD